MKNNQVYDYIVGLSDEKKLIFSRKIYSKLLREDFVFAKNINGLALGKDCELNDRFLFLYLCDEKCKFYIAAIRKSSTWIDAPSRF